MLSKEVIERQSQKALDIIPKRRSLWIDTDIISDRVYLENKDLMSHEIMRAKVEEALLDSIEPIFDPDDLIAGRLDLEWHEENNAEREKMKELCKARGEYYNGIKDSANGHTTLDYEKLLEKGIGGVLKDVKERLLQVRFDDPDGIEKRKFYEAAIISLEAAVRFGNRYHDEAVRLAKSETDPQRKAALERMADSLSRVPNGPAETFFDALQSLWLYQIMVWVVRELAQQGRPDNFLYPYYKKDIEEGRITPDEAMSLIEDWYLRINYFWSTKRTSATSLMVGGRDRQGNVVCNELTYMFVRAIETTGVIYPSVGLAYNSEIPDDLLDLCIEMNAKGYTRPALFNDDIIIKGLKDAGVSDEDANYYIHSTCVEITPIATSNVWVASKYINLNKIFEYLLNDGKQIFDGEGLEFFTPFDSDPKKLDTFPKFYNEIKKIVDNVLKGEIVLQQERLLMLRRCCCMPLVDCFTKDCVEKGKNSVAGGTRYRFIYPSFPGFSNFVDSIAAIRKAVYEDKLITLDELGEALKNDFKGFERIHAFLLNKCPKFCNDLDDADDIAADMFKYIRDELKMFNGCEPNTTFHFSCFAYLHHGRLGLEASASPDGRNQGEALSECLGPVQGMDKNGPLALVNSLSKIPQESGIGGIATNFRFSKKIMREKHDEIKALVKDFMRRGNFEMQFNVVDQETLKDAKAHPEKYRTLMVRVAGYSDYFVMLPPEIQNEVMKRLEHDDL